MTRRARRRPLPVVENPVDVVDLAHDGRGVARIDGKVLFVAGALPGERVRVRVTQSHREFDEAYAIAIDLPSVDRVEPRCAHFGVCGGCALQHLAPTAQVAFKQKQLLEALTRLGGVTPEQIAPPVTGPVWHYRRRARLGAHRHRGDAANGVTPPVRVGFRERDNAVLARITRCEVLDERVADVLPALAALVESLSLREQVPQIEVAAAVDRIALVFRVLAAPTPADRAALAAFAADSGFELYLQTGGPATLAPLQPPASALCYSPDAGAHALVFTPIDFIQVNGAVNETMVRQALAWLDPQPGDTVLELFAGLGNFTIPLAAAGARVTAVEGEAGLVARGRDNLHRNGLDATFLQADLFQPSARPWGDGSFDGALLDPPRAGAREVLPTVAAAGPRRIVYVSCHPGTLARDAGELVRTHGYRLRRAGVLDMFSHTAHVESMALFERS